MVSINKCKVILIYAHCPSVIMGSLMNLSNKLTDVSAMTSVTILYSWGKVYPLKPHHPFSVAVTHILLYRKRSDGLFRPTERTRFLILRFLPNRRGVIFSDMVGWSLNFLVVFCFSSFPALLFSLYVLCFFSAPDLLDSVFAVAVVPLMALGITNIEKFDLTCR